jgi:hypothetical protein
MAPKYQNGNVIAVCPICGIQTTFEAKQDNREYGSIVLDNPNEVGWPGSNRRIVFRLLKCAGCGRAGLAAISDNGRVVDGALVEFLPLSVETLTLPQNVPQGIREEFREAEKDASVGSYRSGSAMLRSALEKTLKAHGYTQGGLEVKINEAAEDGVITLPLKKRAHDNVRVLGNNILHDEWRPVEITEFEDSHEYTRRVLECFYDDPETVKQILKEKGREVVEEVPQEVGTEEVNK